MTHTDKCKKINKLTTNKQSRLRRKKEKKKKVNKLFYFDSSLSLSLWAYINGLSLVCKCARLCEWLQAVYYSSPEGLGSIWPRIWHSAPSINAATTLIFYQCCLSSACRFSPSLHLSGFAVFLFFAHLGIECQLDSLESDKRKTRLTVSGASHDG